MVSPLDPQTPVSMNPPDWLDALAEQFAAAGLQPPLAFGDKGTRPRVVPTPGGSPTMTGMTGPMSPEGQNKLAGMGVGSYRPMASPMQPTLLDDAPPMNRPPPGQNLDPVPEEQPPPAAVAQESPLDIRTAAQMQPSGNSQRDAAGLALQGLKMMQAPEVRAPHPIAPPRTDVSGIGRVDPMVLIQNAQKAGGAAPLLLLSQLLGRG